MTGIRGELTIPKVAYGKVTAVDPRLVALTVKEPAVLRTDSHIEDKVELLVEWSVRAALNPWVVDKGSVACGDTVEFTLCPEIAFAIVARVHDLLETAVKVQEEVVLGPLKAEGVIC